MDIETSSDSGPEEVLGGGTYAKNDRIVKLEEEAFFESLKQYKHVQPRIGKGTTIYYEWIGDLFITDCSYLMKGWLHSFIHPFMSLYRKWTLTPPSTPFLLHDNHLRCRLLSGGASRVHNS
jgi:hypothetical protein